MQGISDALPAAAFTGPAMHRRLRLSGVTVCVMSIADRIMERLDELAGDDLLIDVSPPAIPPGGAAAQPGGGSHPPSTAAGQPTTQKRNASI
jgi:hypothetical protein